MNTINDSAVALVSVWLVDGAAAGFIGWGGKLLAWRPLVYLGTISYGIYVFHHIILVEVWPRLVQHGFQSLHTPYDFLFLYAATVAVAALSWHLFERPINGLKRHFAYQEGPRDTI